MLVAVRWASPALPAYIVWPNEPISSSSFLGQVSCTTSPMYVSDVIASGIRINQTGILPEKSLEAVEGSDVNTLMSLSSTGMVVEDGLRTR